MLIVIVLDIFQVDEQLRAETVEVYYDQAEFMAGLLKGPTLPSTGEKQNT
jgi:hypothetical protein